MSTRANIVVKDDWSELWFYRHSDGYPDGALPLLKKFMQWVTNGKLRRSVSQSAGALILLGAEEYNISVSEEGLIRGEARSEWKCGSIEPTEKQHGDIAYLYTLDLTNLTIKVEGVRSYNEDENETIEFKPNENLLNPH